MSTRQEDGFTLIEVLTAIGLFSIVLVAFYQVLFAGVRGGATTRSVVRISEEARSGFNRMARDTREAERIDAASATSYNVKVDFDDSGTYVNDATTGNYENLTFVYQASDGTLRLNGEILMAGVTPIGGEVFDYSSNILEYDWDANGITTWQELDVAPTRGITGVGNNNGILDLAELPFISNVHYSLLVSEGGRSTNFFAEAELRNRR